VPKLKLDISTSLDGYIAGPEQTLQDPLGQGGERLHEWVFGLKSFRERHGMSGGETGADDEIVAETVRGIGAVVMGRKMFSGGAGPWETDPNADAWWGDDPPFRVPVFVLTHHERPPLVKQGGTTFTFVTDGIEDALEQAWEAAGDKDVYIGGGADIINQYLAAGLVDELEVHIAPLILGAGERLFDGVGPDLKLEQLRAVEGPGVAHLKYRVVK